MFALLGGFWIYSAFETSLQALAYLTSTISVVSFLWISLAVGNYNYRVHRVVQVDVIALFCIIIGTVAFYNLCLGKNVTESTCGRR